MNQSVLKASGQVQVREYTGFGGDRFDAKHVGQLFNYEAPHRFDSYIAKLYSSSDQFDAKMFTGATLAKGNFKEIVQDRYTWLLEDDDEKALTVMAFVEGGNTAPCWNNGTCRVVLDEFWLHEPDVIVGSDNNFPLEIVGTPVPYQGYSMYTIRLQDGDPDASLPIDLLQIGQIFRKQSTSVGTDNNQIWGTTQFGSYMELECQIGQYAENIIVEEKLIRQEKAARENGNQINGISSGYYIPLKGKNFGKDGDAEQIKKGMFISAAESQMHKQIEHDREWSCLYGRASSRKDYAGRSIKRTAPGLRQLSLDGHIFFHNGSITAQELKDFIMDIWFSREDENQRKLTIDTGTGGSDLFHVLLANEANAFLTVDTHFVKEYGGANSRHLSFGARFVHFWAGNGVEVDLVLNKWKDSTKYCGRTHPDNPHMPIDSFRMDVYDWGKSGGQDNITMLMQKYTSYYAMVCDLIDPYGHYVAPGTKVSTTNKDCQWVRETSGSPFVRDCSRIGAIIYDPAYIG